MIKINKITTYITSALLLLAWVMPACANEDAAIMAKYGAIEHRLNNGFRVVFVPDAKASQIAVNLVYFSGSLADPLDKAGLAHMVEHLLFNANTQQGGTSLTAEMARRNISFNATTSYDRTLYTGTFTADQQTLNWLLQEEAARMRHLAISQADIKRELAVVLREKEISESNPQLRITQKMLPIASGFLPYSRSPIGVTADLSAITVDDAKAFYQTHYQPDNALIVITGRFDSEITLKQLQASFGEMIVKPKQAFTQHSNNQPIKAATLNAIPQQTEFTGKGDTALVTVMYPVVGKLNTHDVAALTLLNQVLSGSPASRLHEGLIKNAQAAGVVAAPILLHNAGVLQVAVAPNNNEGIAQARTKLYALINQLTAEPITLEETERAKTILSNAQQQLLANPAVIGQILAEYAAVSDWQLFFNVFDLAATLTNHDVQASAVQYLKNNQAVTGILLATAPEKQKLTATDNQRVPFENSVPMTAISNMGTKADSTHQSEAVNTTATASDGHTANSALVATQIDTKIARFSLNNSLAVALWPKDTSGNRVQGVWNLRMGTAETLFGKRVLAGVTAMMLNYGSTTVNQKALFDRVNQLGAGLAITPDDDRLAITFDVPAKSLTALLDLIVNVLHEPALPPSAFKEVVNQLTIHYQAVAAQPSIKANEALILATSLYPVGDIRRDPSVEEALTSLKAITHQDVVDFHATFYGANGQMMLTGDFDAQQVREQLTQLLSPWKSQIAYQRPLAAAFVETKPTQLYVKSQDKAHGLYIAKKRLALNANSTDALALMLANQIIGEGALQSRLGKRLRKNDGISYSVESKINFSRFEPLGTFTVNATYSPNQRKQLTSAIHEELSHLCKDGMSDQELQLAKESWYHKNDLAKQSDDQLFGKLGLLLRLNQTMQYYADENANIAQLTLAQVNAAIARHLNPNQLAEAFVDSGH